MLQNLLKEMGTDDERNEIAFFDVETTVPTRTGQGFALLEFGSILVCPRKLVELHSYSSLIRPADISLINSISVRCNGITPETVSSAPTFSEIADQVYDILHGRIWAGHNILRFDCPRIKEAFAEIGRPAPEPKGTIDSLALLTQRFGRRAGDMKMATLATYFGLGQQTHRSLDDVRMNLEVLKYCATVLFLESSLPDIFTANSWVSPNATTRSRSNGKTSSEVSANPSNPSLVQKLEGDLLSPPTNQRNGDNHPILSLVTQEEEETAKAHTAQEDPFDMRSLSDRIKTESFQLDVAMEDRSPRQSSDMCSPAALSEGSSGFAGYLEPEEVYTSFISASFVPFNWGIQRIRLFHKGAPLQLLCTKLKVRFGANLKYTDSAGRPKLSFVVDAPPSLCRILDTCDGLAQKLSVESGSSSEWKHVVTRKNGFVNFATVRLHIPVVTNSGGLRYETEMIRKESSGSTEKLMFSQCNASELESVIKPGTFVDACFSLDTYDYQQYAGIRLVANKLTICS